MSEKTNGGPAFPTMQVGYDGAGAIDGGMTLRDWFAGQALAGILSASATGIRAADTTGGRGDDFGVFISDLATHTRGGHLVAAAAYTLADALLKARGEA